MKTLEQIKNEYAVSKGFINWEDLEYDMYHTLSQHINKVMKIYAMECLKHNKVIK